MSGLYLIVGGVLGLVIGGIFGPIGALVGFIIGATVGGYFWENTPNTSKEIEALEERIDELERKLDE